MRPIEFDDFEDIEHRLARIRNRVHYFHMGERYAHHTLAACDTDKDILGYAVEDIEELLGLMYGAGDKLDDHDREIESVKNDVLAAETCAEEAEEVRNDACLEAEEARKEIAKLKGETEPSEVMLLERQLQKARGEAAFLRRALRENDKALVEAKAECNRKLREWRKRFDALPATWQERIMQEDLF